MRTRAAALFLFAAVAPVRAQEPGTERLSFADLQKQISWVSAVPGAGIAWDGKHVEYVQGKAKGWLDPATGETAAALEAPKADDANPATRKAVRIHEGDLWLESIAADGPQGRGAPGARGRRGGRPGRGEPGPDAVRLTRDGATTGSKAEAHANEAGTFASFVRGGNLVLLGIGDQQEWQVTSDGGKDRLHGILDWVYQEEVYGRGDFQAHWWSPQGDMVAFLSLDESAVKEFTLVNHVPEGFLDRDLTVAVEATDYPKAGDPNPVASLSVAHASTRKVVPVDLSAYPKDVLVVRVGWTPDAGALLVTLQDRIQTWAELCAVDPATGKLTRWIREESQTWTNRPEPPRWLPDGSFLWLSERNGYQHVYRHRPGGELVNAVTSGDWQVRTILDVDAERALVWFEGTKDGATGRHVYRVGLDGQGLVGLTPGEGTHSAQFTTDRRFLVDTWSAMDRPPTAVVRDGETGAVLKELGQAQKGAASQYAFSEKLRIVVPARDGYLLDASVMLPPAVLAKDWPAGTRHPVYLPTYSGPDSSSVRDAWGHSTYHQFLAQQGFLVMQANVRSASGRGQAHTGLCYQRLGEQELKDLEDAVDFVCREHGGDPSRVAIEGWSYGGFMAAFALTHSRKFALGLAGAGVYDWRLYDTIYTERYMRTPQENKQGYDATSVIKAAADLHGHLVLMHGTMDDNVHLQNTMQLLWELEKAGKQDFELMLYPRSRHGLAHEVEGHRREYAWRALKRLLDPAWKAE